jgi:hypothetical protein
VPGPAPAPPPAGQAQVEVWELKAHDTPVSCSDSSHRRRDVSASRACEAGVSAAGWPPDMPEPVSADVGAAGDIRGGGVEGRERPHGVALCDEPVGDGREEVGDRAGRASLQVGGGVAGMGGYSPDRRSRIGEASLEFEDEEQVGQLGPGLRTQPRFKQVLIRRLRSSGQFMLRPTIATLSGVRVG